MKTFKIIGLIIAVIIVIIALDFGFGYLGVFKTKTVGKAKQNAKTEVYYETQSFVTAKKQEALKFYQEYQNADTDGKKSIKMMVSYSFSDFDENKLDSPLREFIYNCKY